LVGNELYGIFPTTIIKQTLMLNNHGNYIIYSSTSTNNINYQKNLLFNYNLSDSEGSHWATGQYTSPVGDYSANTSYIKSDFRGDWIIIKFPIKIILSRFRFYFRTGNISRAPALWKCYGSNDGINFTEITEASNSITKINSDNYSLGYYEDILGPTFDIPYLYIGWVVNKLVGIISGDASIMNFLELQIFGKDDISNSYSKQWSTLSDNRVVYNNPSTITTYLSTQTLDLTNKYLRFNYDEEVYINSGVSTTITFGNGSHSINTTPPIPKYTYPILKDNSSNIINPLIWYKFDSSPNALIDSGSLNNGTLINSANPNQVTFVSTANNYIRGNSSAYFSLAANFLTIPNTIDFNLINIATGISFSFWIKITTSSGASSRIFDFGASGNPATQYISIYKNGVTNHLTFDINGITASTGSITPLTISNYFDSVWRQITWTISTAGAWNIYINNSIATFSSALPTTRIIPSFTSKTYYIGKSVSTGVSTFNTMYIDDFRIYQKVLTATEVSELYFGRVEVYNKNNIGIGTTNPNTNYILDVNGNANVNGVITTTTLTATKLTATNSINVNTPQLGVFGGTGDKFILYTGTASVHPYSLGINGAVMWYSVPLNASHIFYVNGSPIASINNVGIGITGTLTTTSSIRGTTFNCCDSVITAAALVGRLLNVVGTNAVMRIWRNDGLNSPGMEFMSGTISSATSYTKFWDMGIGGTDGANYFYIRDRKPPSRFLNRIIIDDIGNVGIGTTTTDFRLNVEGSFNSTSFYQNTVLIDFTTYAMF